MTSSNINPMHHLELAKNIKQILGDNTSGSTLLSARIENIFPYIPDDRLNETLARILSTHSSMAAVINRINYLCLQKEGVSVNEPNSFPDETFKQFWSENQNRHRWITLSMSHWVIECLKYNQSRCKIKIGVSRPDNEGMVTREMLAKYHDVQIFDDTRLIAETEKSDGIILGADMVGKRSIVNKSGSFALALAANYFKKPIYILSSGDKTLTEELHPFFRMKKVKTQFGWVHYFEEIPPELVTRIYLTTEKWQFPLSDTLKGLELKNPQDC